MIKVDIWSDVTCPCCYIRGLNVLDVEMMLKSDDFTDEVRYVEKIAQDLGITGVPFFCI